MKTHSLKIKTAVEPLRIDLSSTKLVLQKHIQGDIIRYRAAVRTGVKTGYEALSEAQRRVSSWSDQILHCIAWVKRNAVRAVIGVLIADSILLLLFVVIRVDAPFSPNGSAALRAYLAPLADASSGQGVGEQKLTGNLAALNTAFQNAGLAAEADGQTTKPGFSVPGNIVAVDGDTVLVFAYANPQTAENEATALAKRYGAENAKNNLWSAGIHLYTKDTLVIFYLGTHTAIINALSQFTGESLVQNASMF